MKTVLSLDNKKSFIPPVVIVIVAIFIPQILTNGYHVHMLNVAMINLIAVYGLYFISGMAGQTNLGQAGVFGIGGYASSLFVTHLGVPAWLGILPAIAGGILIGIILGYPSLRIKGLFLTLTTIAFTEIMRLIENNWELVGGALGVKGVPNFFFLGIEIKTPQQFFYLMLVFTIVFSIITYRISHSKWGRAFIAVRDNSDAVASCGINLAQAKITAFTLSSIYGAVAGAIYSQCINYVNASIYTTELSILFVVMMMFGGFGNLYGILIGTVVITLLPEILRILGDYYQLVYAIIVMLFAIFLPGGVISINRKRIERQSFFPKEHGGH